MLRGTLLLGMIVVAGTACGTDNNDGFESDYSENGAWRDIAEKGCIEGMPAELHIEVEVDGEMRVLDMALEGDHTDVRGRLQVDGDVVELRDWEPGKTPAGPAITRVAQLLGYAVGGGEPEFRVIVSIFKGSAEHLAVSKIGPDGMYVKAWELNFGTDEFGTPGMSDAGAISDEDAVSLRVACL